MAGYQGTSDGIHADSSPLEPITDPSPSSRPSPLGRRGDWVTLFVVRLLWDLIQFIDGKKFEPPHVGSYVD